MIRRRGSISCRGRSAKVEPSRMRTVSGPVASICLIILTACAFTMAAHAVADVKGPDGAVFIGFPRGGEIGFGLAAASRTDEAALDFLDDLEHPAVGGGIEAGLCAEADIMGMPEGAGGCGLNLRPT